MIVGFGARLRDLRTGRGLTQVQLASRLQVTKSVISAYETDVRLPSYDTLLAIARTFGVTTDYLLGREKTKWDIDLSELTDCEINALISLIDAIKKK